MIETIRIEIDPETVGLSLQLQLAERWCKLYSSNRGHFVVTTGNDDGRKVVKANLGTHRFEEIPPCKIDHLARKRSDPTEYVLVDLAEDPEQRQNLVHARPEIFNRFHGHLEALLASSDSWGRREEGAEVELSEETVEQLKALGYLD